LKLREEITNNTTKFIRWYFKKYTEANPYEVFQILKEIRKQQKTKRGKPRKYPTSKSVNHYFFIMKELGLIRQSRVGDITPIGTYKKYYVPVQKFENHKAWIDPQKYYRKVKGQ
jgi:hypothetical protein